jgi:outer membrane protein assembly factor BamB
VTVRKAVQSIALALLASSTALGADWPEWRGPTRNGLSAETGLPSRWSASGEGLLWKKPYGSRSSPVVVGDRLYLLHPAGKGETLREQLSCLNANTGDVIWEYTYNVFHSDVPPWRLGWSSPAVDLGTGNVYVFGVGANLIALSKDGKKLWERALSEEFGAITTHGGRTVSPVIEGDLILVSTLTSGWGDQARGNNRYFAFDKKTGETVWVNSPQVRHYDTNYSGIVPTTIDGQRVFLVGGSDGTIHSIKVATGEPVWHYDMSKRAILTSVVLKDGLAVLSHSEENLDTSEMGMVAVIDAAQKGEVKNEQLKWRDLGVQVGFSSPLVEGNRIYAVDNGANLLAFDLATGKELWKQNLGTIQKASPVMGDGKIYVGTENGKFFIVKPGPDKAEILDSDLLGTEATPEVIVASPVISNGKVFFASMDALYCIGKKSAGAVAAAKPAPNPIEKAPADAKPAHLQVVPTELILKPGEKKVFHARLFDDKGRFIREEPTATWALERLKGQVTNGELTLPAENVAQAGLVTASVGELKASARLRVSPPLPWSWDFEAATAPGPPPPFWVNGTGKMQVRDLDGKKVLVKLADNPFTKRGRFFFGSLDLHDYTTETSFMSRDQKRHMGDAGVIAQRYILVLFGDSQKAELQAWQPETTRTLTAPFAWKGDTWYRMKLRVESLPEGKTRARAKIWPVGENEPEAWLLERVDPIGHRNGSPGLYADAPVEVFFDDVKVTANQ